MCAQYGPEDKEVWIDVEEWMHVAMVMRFWSRHPKGGPGDGAASTMDVYINGEVQLAGLPAVDKSATGAVQLWAKMV